MIKIELNEAAGSFAPGTGISGMVHWDSETPESIDIRLIWYTSGKGDRDFDVAASQTVSSPRTQRSHKFEFEAPNYPHSFSGKLISLIWAIEVILFPSRDAEVKEIVIAPGGKEIVIKNSGSFSS